jgi:hypothetical protein
MFAEAFWEPVFCLELRYDLLIWCTNMYITPYIAPHQDVSDQ